MTQSETTRPPRRRPGPPRVGRRANRILLGLAAGLAILLVLLLSVYAARREVARHVLVGWLEERGVQAEVAFERLDPGRLVASIRAGDPDDPDLVVPRVEVDYAIGLPWSGGLGISPSRIRLIRPEVRASFVEGRLSFGALDPVIEEFADRPPRPERAGPTILVEDGRFRLDTRGGRLTAVADARIEDGRLIRLDAAVPAARLRDEALALDLERAGLAVRTVGDRTTLAVVARVEALSGAGLSGRGGELRLRLEAPYPDTRLHRAAGPVRLDLDAGLDQASWDGGAARELAVELDFDGRANGWIEAFAFLGRLTGRLSAERLDAGDAGLQAVALRLDGEQVRFSRRDETRWSYDGRARLSARAAEQGDLGARGLALQFDDLVAGGARSGWEARSVLGLAAEAFRRDELTLTGVSGRFDLDSGFSGAMLTTLTGAVRASGGRWPVLGEPGANDIPEQAALKRAFAAFALEAPGLTIQTGSPGTEVVLTRPAQVRPATGGVVTVTPRSGQSLYSAAPERSGGGVFDLASSGGGLPEARVGASYRMADGLILAEIDGRADFDFGLARDASIETAGLLRIGGGRTEFQPRACSPFTAALLELGENDVADVSASLCAVETPMLTIADGWRFEARAEGLSAVAPFLGMRASGVSGRVSARDPGGALVLHAQVADGLVSDTQTPTRFHPLRAAGRVGLSADVWTGAIQLRERTRGSRVADLSIRHSGPSNSGGVEIDAAGLVFAPEGLQPAHISPLAVRFVGTEVSGPADFTGFFRWTPEGATSGGRFSTPGLDFDSPVGAVVQARGTIDFVSLTPLVTAPGQRLAADSIGAFLPLSEAGIGFELTPHAVRVGEGRVAVAGGFASLEPAEIPLDPNTAWEGVLVLENVQLGEIFARSGFSESVRLDAVVSGRLPFVAGPNGVTVIGGEVEAVQPGRLSIAREALSGMAAEGGGEAVPPNTVQDFAYQALENLSFDQLEAELNSLPQGRLGVLFNIHGRHDPPVAQEIRLGLMELINRDFMDRVLPLPSGTEINLTLDTSFNLDQLVADLMEIQRARGAGSRSETVQPEGR